MADKVYYLEHREERLAYQREYDRQHRQQKNLRKRRYRKRHKGKTLIYRRRYYQEHREEELAYKRRYQQEHGEEIAARKCRWRQENQEQCRASDARYEARKHHLPNTLTTHQAKRLLSMGRAVFPGERLHLDHIIPVSQGGGTTLANMQAIPASLNLSKSNKLPGEAYEQIELFA